MQIERKEIGTVWYQRRQDQLRHLSRLWRVIALLFVVRTANPQSLSFIRNDIATGLAPQVVALADFNRDGRGDIAVLNSGSGSISILLSNGDGSFQSARTTLVAISPLFWRW